MAIKHGVYVYESDTALSAPILSDSSVQCVVGAAPVWMLDDPAEVTNVPVLATSATEAMERLGYLPDFANYGLCQTMYITSNVFPVQPVVYINVLDVATMRKAQPDTVSLTAPVASSVVIDKVGAIKSTVSVVQGETTLEKDVDYTIAYNSEGKLVINFIPDSAFDASVATTVTCTLVDLTKVTAEKIIGSYNVSTGVSTGLELVQSVYPKLGVIPCIILAPNFSQISEVGIAMTAKAANINGVFKGMAFLDIDTAAARLYTATKNVKENAGFTSPFCACFWPCLRVGDHIFAASVVMGALTAYTIADNGDVPSRSPSNKMIGVTGTCLADGTEILLNQDQGTIVNSYGIITAINLNGWRSWGSYTGAYPNSTDVKDIWLPVRQMFNWQGNTFILTYFDKVDDPLNQVLVESIVDSENIRCSAYTPDVWAGAEIQYLESDNPVTNLLAGKVVFRQRIAPYTPAQEIDNILSYDTTALADVMGSIGGE